MATAQRTNPRMAREASAYLRAAATQPVDWYPWSAEAFDRARREDRPLLLDIGAVWCHWCHVMDHESYEDPEVATLINERFVPIKVDRDERPDVDLRYQRSVSAISGQGGWPLTAFLLPDGRVFFGGTYFPPRDAHGRPSFRRVLESVAEAYRTQRDDVVHQAGEIASALRESTPTAGPASEVTPTLVDQALHELHHGHDPVNGGWGSAPKFPHPSALEVLLVAQARRPVDERRALIEATLDGMARGGIHDQVGGGFHRYSVDTRWHVPHFEKMLYDNAELLRNYSLAAHVLGRAADRAVAADTIGFLHDVLGDRPRGGFGGSQDADVGPNDDGDYFTWTPGEVLDALAGERELAKLVGLRFDVKAQGQMHHNPAKNVLRVAADLDDLAAATKRTPAEVDRQLSRARELLRTARARRRAPFIDRTLYTNWNAMATRAFFEAGAVLDRPDAIAFARRTLDRFLADAYDPARGFARTAGGRRDFGWLDDNAQMLPTLCVAFTLTQHSTYLDRAREVAALLRTSFWDEERIGFGDVSLSLRGDSGTPAATAELVLQDAPSPSANARAAEGLLLLAELTGDDAHRTLVGRILEAHLSTARRFGLFGAHLIRVADQFLRPAPKVVIAGPRADTAALHRSACPAVALGTMVRVVAHGDAPAGVPPEVTAFLEGPARQRAAALVCVGTTCLAPVHEPQRLPNVIAEALALQSAAPAPARQL